MHIPMSNTIIKAFKRADVIHIAEGYTDQSKINLSSIATHIIQVTGRFAEHHASDMLFDWDTVRELTSNHVIEPLENNIVLFGIYENGVDSNAEIMQNLKTDCLDRLTGYVHPKRRYRKILAVQVKTEFPEVYTFWSPMTEAYTTVVLKDLTNEFISLDDEDSDWTMESAYKEHAKKLECYLTAHPDMHPNVQKVIKDNIAIYGQGRPLPK